MRDGDRGLVPGDPAGSGEAVAEVEVLHVEPVALVEEPDFGQCAAADEHERAAHGVDRPALDVRRAVLGERGRGARAPTDAGEVCERAERGREGAPRRVVEGAVLAYEPAPADADARVLVHQPEQALERA